MNPKVYPTITTVDFASDMMNRVNFLLKKPLQQILPKLSDCLSAHENLFLTCVLRSLLEKPITPEISSILGWFTINDLIPTPTLYLLLNKINTEKNTQYGMYCTLAYVNATLPYIHKYPTFCKSLLSAPNLQYLDSYIYILLKHVANNEPAQRELFSQKNHYVIPELPRYFKKPKSVEEKEFPPEVNLPMKENIFEAIKFSKTLDTNQQKAYCAQICLCFNPPLVPIQYPMLLEAACDYSMTLIRSAKNRKWRGFDVLPYLEQLGYWVGAMSIANGNPPPLYMINFQRVLLESAYSGTLCQAMVFVTAFFKKALVIYKPPCPYTVTLLEIMAAIAKSDGIRSDILQMITAFARMFKLDVDIFFKRSIDLPIDSFDRHAVFVHTTAEAIPRFLSTRNVLASSNGIQQVQSYFSYLPSLEGLPDELRNVAEAALKYERLYFVGPPTDVHPPYAADVELLPLMRGLISLSMSDTTIMSKTATLMFTSLAAHMQPVDVTGLFRFAFPKHEFFRSFVRFGKFDLDALNSIFSDLLVNPMTAAVAHPHIMRYLSMLPYDPAAFVSTYRLTGYTPSEQPPEIPSPDISYTQLAIATYNYAIQQTDETRTAFVNALSPANANQMRALILMLIHISEENDYSMIDFIVQVFGKCTSKIAPDVVISGIRKALESLPSTVLSRPHSSNVVFRIIYGTLSSVTLKQREKLISLLEFLSPQHFPTFATCWIQLCMHPQAFPTFVRCYEKRFSQFCLNFINIVIALAVKYPEGFYRPAARVLLLINADSPQFLSAYYAVIIENLPISYTQFRNIILGAIPPESGPDMQPHIAFNYTDALESKALTVNLRPFLRATPSDSGNAQFIASTLRRACLGSEKRRIFWQFVVFCVSNITSSVPASELGIGTASFKKLPLVGLFAQLLQSFRGEAARLMVTGILDLLRFSNLHTRFASELAFALFEIGDSHTREIIFTELARKLLCVSAPPRSVRGLYARIMATFKNELNDLFGRSKEMAEFNRVCATIGNY